MMMLARRATRSLRYFSPGRRFEDAVGLEHLAVHVAEEGKSDADLLGEGRVGSGTIHADAEDFRIRGVDLTGGDSSLDRLKLLRSTTREARRKRKRRSCAEVAELHGFPPSLKGKSGAVSPTLSVILATWDFSPWGQPEQPRERL